MTQEDKDPLLKDLYARLPYGVKGKVEVCSVIPNSYDIDGFPVETTFDAVVELKQIDVKYDKIFVEVTDNEDLNAYILDSQTDGAPWTIEDFKPYLRKLSSITKKEEREYRQISELEHKAFEGPEGLNIESFLSSTFAIDFCNKHHFDYRGLIGKGLALEAPEDMYK